MKLGAGHLPSNTRLLTHAEAPASTAFLEPVEEKGEDRKSTSSKV